MQGASFEQQSNKKPPCYQNTGALLRVCAGSVWLRSVRTEHPLPAGNGAGRGAQHLRDTATNTSFPQHFLEKTGKRGRKRHPAGISLMCLPWWAANRRAPSCPSPTLRGGASGLPPCRGGFFCTLGVMGRGYVEWGRAPSAQGWGKRGMRKALMAPSQLHEHRCSYLPSPANPSALGLGVSPSSPTSAPRGRGVTGAGGRAAGRVLSWRRARARCRAPSRISASLGAILLPRTRGHTAAGIAAGTHTLFIRTKHPELG